MRSPRIEIPTLLLALAINAGWALLTSRYRALPLVVVLPLAAFLIAWHGSLQHEAVHGHPTRSPWVNMLLVGLPLSLWLPYPLYRASHLAHHQCRRITDPLEDPESYYVSAAAWRRMGAVKRRAHLLLSTLCGRLVLGPFFVVGRLIVSEARRLKDGDREHLAIWLWHLLACALVVAWLRACGIPLASYLAVFVYPGLALTLLRSYTEHRPAERNGAATIIIEASPLWSLLYLNNNLHAVHHRNPALPWYRLPAVYRQTRDEVLADNAGWVVNGYGQVLRQFAFRSKGSPVHG
jgi:fatty acid desaturase